MSCTESVIITPFVIFTIVALYQVAFGISAGCMNPIHIWWGRLSDRDFDWITEQIFTSVDTKITDFEARGAGHVAWIANRFYGFSLNGSKEHSYFQKRRFFKKLEETKIKRPGCIVTLEDELRKLRAEARAVALGANAEKRS